MFNKAKKNTIYSIRKSAMGAASVTIGTCLLLGMTHTASADEREQNRIDSETTTAPKQGTNESNPSATQSTSPTSTENHTIHTKQADTIHKETEKRKETAINHAKQSINDSTESIPNQNTSNRNSNKLKPEQKMENHITEQQEVEDNITKQQAGTSNTEYQKEPLLENNAKQKGVNDTKIQKQQQQERTQQEDKQTISKVEKTTSTHTQKTINPNQVQYNNESKQTLDSPNESTTSKTKSQPATFTEKDNVHQSTEETIIPTHKQQSTQKSQNNTVQHTHPAHEMEVTSTKTQPISKITNDKHIHQDTVSNNKQSSKNLENLSNNERTSLLKTIQHDTQEQDKQPKAALQNLSTQIKTTRQTRNATKESTQLNIEHTGRYDSGSGFDKGGTEIVKYNPKNGYAYSINGDKEALDILDIKNTNNKDISLVKRVYLEDAGIKSGDLTSVAVHPNGDYIALSAPAKDKTEPGHVVFYSDTGKYLNALTVGSLLDMVTFTKDGTRLLVANEGEPSDDYKKNPEGSVSIIDTSGSPSKLNQTNVNTVPLTQAHMNDSIRELGPDKSTAYLNLEPEYIVPDEHGKYAYVTIQESSAIAKLDIEKGEFVKVQGLPYKDHSLPENAMDPSDKDGKKALRPVPVLGMLQPDGITAYEYNGETYLLIANEGDAQDYDGYSEEVRVKDIKDDIKLDAKYYEGYTQAELDKLVANGLFDDDQLGRLKVTTSHKFRDKNGKYNALVSFSGRSFSILKGSDLSMVYDSGSDIEQRIKDILPGRFNANYEDFNDIEVDGRSDDKGPEVESIEVGTIGNQTYAFVGLERVGGVMIYNITNPTTPQFTQYLYDEENKDISPEGITFVSSEDSPTGKPMLMVSFELSGTTSTFELNEIDETFDQTHPDGQNDTDKAQQSNNSDEHDDTDETKGEYNTDVETQDDEEDTVATQDNDSVTSVTNIEDNVIENIGKSPAINQTTDIDNSDNLNSENIVAVHHGPTHLNNNATLNISKISRSFVNEASNHTLKMSDANTRLNHNQYQLATKKTNQINHQKIINMNSPIATNTEIEHPEAKNEGNHSINKQQLPNTGQSQNHAPLWSSLILGVALLLIGRKQKSK